MSVPLPASKVFFPTVLMPCTQGRKLPLFICLECSQHPPESVTVFSIPSSNQQNLSLSDH